MRQRIIALFDKEPDEYLSGEQMSKRLDCSRTAVWKHIQELKKQGYQFHSVPNKGYRLVGKPDQLSASAIIASCGNLEIFSQLKLFGQVGSTQTIGHELAVNGEKHGTLIVADSQSSGRGRHGRPWYSPAGQGIWMSLLLRPNMPLNFAPRMTLLTAVALCRTARKSLGADVGIKWPNDLLIGGKKISGILVDSVGEDELVRYLIVGVGIDCNMTVEDYPPDLAQRATSLYIETGKRIDRSRLIGEFLTELNSLFHLYFELGFAPIRTLWESLSVTIGHQVSIMSGDQLIEGIAETLDDSGALVVLLPDGTKRMIYSGESR